MQKMKNNKKHYIKGGVFVAILEQFANDKYRLLQYLSENFYASTKLRQNENGVIYVEDWVVDVVGKVQTLRFRDGTKGVGVGIPYYIAEELEKIYIPESVMYISQGAFSNCNSAKFYCEAQSKPKTWIIDWCPSGSFVKWGYTDE